uniref:uncharacterized protein LOC113475483 isoform X4 n=1 Tax=Ciona intestinalis TaxID=7719 RepID=UPI000EF529BE|nr:uncharacterized protein LOC113475483 isoform X4 [Ciona intestinalis]|eukprot:XP_026695459.1 uncharacterized protein LOC113475483 isoform X4 [Ciona intestinalis]
MLKAQSKELKINPRFSDSESENFDTDTVPTSCTKVQDWFAKNDQEKNIFSLISSSDELEPLDARARSKPSTSQRCLSYRETPINEC